MTHAIDDADLAEMTPEDGVIALLDDAQGRFRIDPNTGCITLADPRLLYEAFGAVFPVRLRMRAFGVDQEFDCALRVDGPVPTPVCIDGKDPLAAQTFAGGAVPSAAALGRLDDLAGDVEAPFGAALMLRDACAAPDGMVFTPHGAADLGAVGADRRWSLG